MKNNGNIIIEFTIYVTIIMLIIFSLISIGMDKVNTVKIESELIKDSLIKDHNSSYLFSNKKLFQKKFDLSQIYTIKSESKKVSIYNGVGSVKRILNNLHLLEDIVSNLNLYQEVRQYFE
jgi:hypothetical protein